jgi:hypothetical protein
MTVRILDELGLALSRFGTYSFDDKGSHEVMSLYEIGTDLEKLPAEEAGMIILQVAKSKKYAGRGERVASDLLCGLQEWDELFEIPGVSDYL